MKETAFLNWLIENGKKENSARSTVSRIKRIEEVYPDLDSRYEDDSLETLLSVLTYTKKDEAKNREPLHKIQIDGDFYTGTCSLRQALSLYLAFRQQGKAVPLHPVAKVDADTQVTFSETNKIYKIDEFREWMYWIHNMKKESASSYVSNLKALWLQINKESDGTLVMDSVGKLLEAGRYAEALNQLDSMDELASLRLLSDNIDASQKKRLNDWRSALRKYIYFDENKLFLKPRLLFGIYQIFLCIA